MTRPLICQCHFCGRVRLNGRWVRADIMADVDADIMADVVGQCATCMGVQRSQARIRASRARHHRAAKRAADAFAGIKYDAE